MKIDLAERDKQIEQYKKDIKFTKATEFENEIILYIEECSRLRNMLEASL